MHRGTWHNGRPVAVKVQYPRAGEALATDLRQLERLIPLMPVAVPGMDARGLVTGLRTRVMAEVDYRQEAAAQTAFAEELRDDPDFAVPSVVAGADRVLVTDWIEGRTLAQVARSGSAPDRERAALCTVRFLLSSPRASGGCTATRTPATSDSCPMAGSRSSTSARTGSLPLCQRRFQSARAGALTLHLIRAEM